MKRILIYFLLLLPLFSIAKPPKKKNKKNRIQLDELVIKPENQFNDYKGSRTRLFDLLHTKIEVEPILQQRVAVGKVALTIKPYFYKQNKLLLDAKYMKINNVKVVANHQPIKSTYSYDSMYLKINFDKEYTKDDTLEVFVEYIAQPYSIGKQQVQQYGRGMYFINSLQKNKYKPFHIWTQGEVEANSFWFPTIDAPNENSSQELYVTVDTAYITLSNGLLIDSKTNGSKRTDYWKQEKIHSPYLFFLAVGDYKKYSTSWHGKSVDYYTFPEYFDNVQQVFGNTPEMLTFFSDLLKIEFPWDKYAQIVAHDYTAGAMENTSAVIFYDRLLADKNQSIDDNFDWIVSHELFHHWFGDLVASESWANLTLNESFADYSEYLWYEYKYGKNDADAYAQKSTEKYIHQLNTKNEPLVNYYYKEHQDNFDGIRYEKGGRILHMLRNYIGDDAFFKSLNLYLKNNQYSSAEVSDFRKAVETVTGEDYNWFFNQWYFSKGHPKLDVQYNFNQTNKTLEIKVKQIQNAQDAPSVFKIPTNIDIFLKDSVIRKQVTIVDKDVVFYFPLTEKPSFVNIDGDGILLADIGTNLSTSEQIAQFNFSKDFKNKYRALVALGKQIEQYETVQQFFIKNLQNTDWNIRNSVLDIVHRNSKYFNQDKLIIAYKNLVATEPKSTIRADALRYLSVLDLNQAAALAEKTIASDSSYQCIAEALEILRLHNYPLAYKKATKWTDTRNTLMLKTVGTVLKDTTINHLEFFKKAISLNNHYFAAENFDNLFLYLVKTKDTLLFKDACAFLLDINQYEESDYNINGASRVISYLKNNMNYQLQQKKLSSNEINIIKNKLEILESVIPKLLPESDFFRF
jgi:aminopeptidase N